MIKRVLLTVAACAAATLSLAGPASAAGSPTTATVVVSGGTLTISVPGSSNLGSVAPGATASGSLGAVKVTDARALLTATWTATVSSSSFVTGGGTTAETIAATNVTYASLGATANSGAGVFTPGQATAGAAVAIDTAKTAFTLTLGVGNNTATWNPTLSVAVPAAAVAAVAGNYSGTITHSVA